MAGRAALGEGEGVPYQLDFGGLAPVWVCCGPTGWGGQEPVEGSKVDWLKAWTSISGGVNKLVDGSDGLFHQCEPFDGIEEAWTGVFSSASHTLNREK